MLETRGIVVNWLSDIFHTCCFVYLVYDLCVLLIYISSFSVIYNLYIRERNIYWIRKSRNVYIYLV